MRYDHEGWKVCYHAFVNNDHLQVKFARYYKDVRDPMSDSLNACLEATEDFHIVLFKKKTSAPFKHVELLPFGGEIVTSGVECEVLDKLSIFVNSKKAANYIWYLAAKQGATFDEIKAMNEAKIFQ